MLQRVLLIVVTLLLILVLGLVNMLLPYLEPPLPLFGLTATLVILIGLTQASFT